ncbi:hypothetical protein HUU42_01885 [bacterium]|nr:hypothetical protein [bacterium]
MESFKNQIFELSEKIRYVAIYKDGVLISSSKQNLQNTSSSESDKYEELIVNPALLTLATQRGNIDCGGCEYILVRYGHFFEYMSRIKDGHVSVGIEPNAEIADLAIRLKKFLKVHE